MKIRFPSILAAAAAAAAFSTGCSTVLPVASHPASAKPDSLRVSVVAQNAEGKTDALSSAAAAAARKAIAAKGFRMEESDSPDIRVSLDSTCREVNRAGDFVLMEGAVAARASVPARDGRVIGEETIKARGERQLGESAAFDSVVSAIAPKVSDWASGTVSASATGVRAETVVVSFADARLKDMPKFKVAFVSAALATPGVRSCALVSESVTPAIAEFRVVYDEGAFPAGLVNELAVRNPDLNLRPGAPL
ncbi:MAG: hypothetical protein IJS46_01580 [Kiritimatiellae bacterium]|nr:hypothetical protein [Kiritimatiellia bacterium]